VDLLLNDQRVLVTGSSSGIGLAIATAFLKEGARVTITGRREGILDAAADNLRSAYGADRVATVRGDLTQSSTAAAAVNAITANWDGLDILVLNLGSGRSVTGLDVDQDEWTRVLQLNLLSSMEMLRLAAPILKSGRNPSVVFVGSIAGLEDFGAPIAYSAAKAALTQAMKAASRLLGADGIRVNMVAPGNIFFEGGTWDRKLKEDAAKVNRMLETLSGFFVLVLFGFLAPLAPNYTFGSVFYFGAIGA
jgi:3-oxoacyl-[acyl-carrier protein] reductase